MFEDSFKNLVTARSLGMSTVFVRSETAREEGVAESKLEGVDAVVDEVSGTVGRRGGSRCLAGGRLPGSAGACRETCPPELLPSSEPPLLGLS